MYGHPSVPQPPCFHPAQHTLQDRTLRLWNPVKGLFIKEYRGHGYEVRDVSVCADNSKMASVGGDRQVCAGSWGGGAGVVGKGGGKGWNGQQLSTSNIHKHLSCCPKGRAVPYALQGGT
jgi:WD40 repeat protein